MVRGDGRLPFLKCHISTRFIVKSGRRRVYSVNSKVYPIGKILMRLIVFCFLIIAGIGVVFYFSWIPQPDFRALWFIPGWLARWCNTHDTLRTAIPFIFLGLLSGFWLAATNRSWYWWLIAWLSFLMVVIIAETGQLFLPQRVFDWRDIVWGSVGTLSGLLAAALFSTLFKKISSLFSR